MYDAIMTKVRGPQQMRDSSTEHYDIHIKTPRVCSDMPL